MSETTIHSVGSSPCITHSGEEPMLGKDTVQEVLARLARGEGVKALARELGVDRKTVKRWRRLGQWRPRQGRPRPRGVDPYLERLAQRGPEVGWNAVVLHRELQGLGFTGSVQPVRRVIRPWRAEARRARWRPSGMRPARASKPRWTSGSSASGSARAASGSICSC